MASLNGGQLEVSGTDFLHHDGFRYTSLHSWGKQWQCDVPVGTTNNMFLREERNLETKLTCASPGNSADVKFRWQWLQWMVQTWGLVQNFPTYIYPHPHTIEGLQTLALHCKAHVQSIHICCESLSGLISDWRTGSPSEPIELPVLLHGLMELLGWCCWGGVGPCSCLNAANIHVPESCLTEECCQYLCRGSGSCLKIATSTPGWAHELSEECCSYCMGPGPEEWCQAWYLYGWAQRAVWGVLLMFVYAPCKLPQNAVSTTG